MMRRVIAASVCALCTASVSIASPPADSAAAAHADSAVYTPQDTVASAVVPGAHRAETDFSYLASLPHRVSGSAQGKKAYSYIRSRVQSIPDVTLYELDVPVFDLRTRACHMDVQGSRVRLYPMRPNVILPPVTDPGGMQAPYVYVESMQALDSLSAPVDESVVGVDYDCNERLWRRLFQLGAEAIVFIGDSTGQMEYPRDIKHAGTAANLVRLYAPATRQDSVDLRRRHDSIRLTSLQHWHHTHGTNLLVHLPGTRPGFVEDRNADEMIVLSAYYDTYGAVPDKSPGATGAANVAALLESIRYFQQNRPKRDMLFVFTDYRHQNLMGMREVYDALSMRPEKIERLVQDHEEEYAFIHEMFDLIDRENIDVQQLKTNANFVSLLQEVTEFVWNNYSEQLMELRLDTPEDERTPQYQEKIDEVKRIKRRWGRVLKYLTKNQMERIDKDDLDKALHRVKQRMQQRLEELAFLQRVDAQRTRIHKDLGDKWINLHIAYKFSDGGTMWGPVVGDDLYRLAVTGGQRKGDWDNPGWYRPVMAAMQQAVETVDTERIPGLNRSSLIDASLTKEFIPGTFINENCVAGIYGNYNCAFMTHHDARPRQGHPVDDTARCRAQRIFDQAKQADALIGVLADLESISLPRSFKDNSLTHDAKFPRWNHGAYRGYSVGIKVAGSLTKDRPATGAILAMWPGAGRWAFLRSDNQLVGFKRFLLSRGNTYGKYRISGVNQALYNPKGAMGIKVLGMMFDSTGRVTASVNQTSQAQPATRVDLFPADGFLAPMPLFGQATSAQTMLMKAAGNVEPNLDRNLHNVADEYVFFYTHDYFSTDRFKIFQKYGISALNVTPKNKTGEGFHQQDFTQCMRIDSISAADLWKLNEGRLKVFRENGVSNADIERLHHEAELYRTEAQDTTGMLASQRLQAKSTMISRLIYEPIRSIMNDMVSAIIVLLILIVPFAFALERLLICSTSIYWRVGGFVIMFIATFALVFFFHPGFSIASSPLIVFLAFAILVMATIVIWIMFSKFKHEIMALQQKSTKAHTGEISRMGTAMAAIGMGMSTMRRRPVRTLLTCITVVVLTFTILCFASFSRGLGVKHAYEGPASSAIDAGVYMRNLDYSPVNEAVLDMVTGLQGKGGLIAPQWWKVKTIDDPESYDIAPLHSEKNTFVSAILGIEPRELDFWDEFAGALRTDTTTDPKEMLARGGVFLPTLMRRQLGLDPGDTVWVDGKKCPFAGEIAVDKLQRLKGLDGKSILPVDFQSQTYDTTKTKGLESNAGGGEMVQRDFVRLSANELVITSAHNVRTLRGNLHAVSVYSDQRLQLQDNAERMAKLTALPVWSRGKEGVERLVFARIAAVSGGMGLVIPILVGGFIIFGTLLGSITDRQKEVYTFSALGLSPSHVGFLFLAESGIYAVIGGVGGQILAQITAYVASILADNGIIHEVSINFSSSNSMFAIVVVMLTVLVSALYPAYKASKSANPGVQRSWKMPVPQGDYFRMEFPFTVSEYDFTGMVSFLAEHFREHGESGMGQFTAEDVSIHRQTDGKHLALSAYMYLAPFDLGIAHRFRMTAVPSEIPGVNEVLIEAWRKSGSYNDWRRSNKVFLRELRKQFILWRTLSSEAIENYRMNTLQVLGEETQTETSST